MPYYSVAASLKHTCQQLTQNAMAIGGFNPIHPEDNDIRSYLEYGRTKLARRNQFTRNRGYEYRYVEHSVFTCNCHYCLENGPTMKVRCPLCGSMPIHPYNFVSAYPIRQLSERKLVEVYAKMLDALETVVKTTEEMHIEERRRKIEDEQARLAKREAEREARRREDEEARERIRATLAAAREEVLRREREYEELLISGKESIIDTIELDRAIRTIVQRMSL